MQKVSFCSSLIAETEYNSANAIPEYGSSIRTFAHNAEPLQLILLFLVLRCWREQIETGARIQLNSLPISYLFDRIKLVDIDRILEITWST